MAGGWVATGWLDSQLATRQKELAQRDEMGHSSRAPAQPAGPHGAQTEGIVVLGVFALFLASLRCTVEFDFDAVREWVVKQVDRIHLSLATM